jgi:phosphoglycolate phosphatase-like HAD superfamily hydrolase
MKKIILFDIDGTLLLTGGAGKRAFNQIFAELYGVDAAWRDIHPDGRTDPCLMREVFEKCLGRGPRPEEMDRLREAYTAVMGQTLKEAENFRLMPGVVELLEKISQRGLGLVGLATGNFEATAYLKLERGGLRDYFSFGGFGSDFEDRLKLTKRAVELGMQKLGHWVEPEEILLVGDTVHDIRCGKLLGLTTIAVATGSTSQETLASLRPDFLLKDLTPTEEALLLFE